MKRAKLGVSISTVDEQTAKDNKLQSLEGALILEVVKGSSADKAGVKEKDVLIGIDSTAIKSPSQLQEKVNNFSPGDKAVLKVVRNGKVLLLPVEFQGSAEENGTVADDGTVAFYGAQLKEVDNGVLIVSAGTGKMAQSGATDGFVIQYVNDQKVSKIKEIIDIAKNARRSIFIEGVTASGRPGYFGFGKD